jgi:hypothetical protein
MLWAIAVILIMMLLLGLVAGIHALLVVALVIALAMINASEAETRLTRSRIRVNSQEIFS